MNELDRELEIVRTGEDPIAVGGKFELNCGVSIFVYPGDMDPSKLFIPRNSKLQRIT